MRLYHGTTSKLDRIFGLQRMVSAATNQQFVATNVPKISISTLIMKIPFKPQQVSTQTPHHHLPDRKSTR